MNEHNQSVIYILGAGSLGCLWAAHLSQNLPVKFISTRIASAYTLNFSFQPFGDSRKKELSFEVLPADQVQHIDTLLLCTKSYDSLKALSDIKSKLTAETKTVLFQNGLGSQFDIIEQFEDAAIFAAVTTEGANRPSSDVVIHAGKGLTQVGPLNKQAQKTIYQNKLNSSLSLSSLDIRFVADVWKPLWLKLAINCAINPFTALLNQENGQVRDSEFFQDNWPDLKTELSDMLTLAGYTMSEGELERSVFDVMNKTAKNISSMLQDVRQAKTTEINDINGFASRYLSEHGHQNSANHNLWQNVLELSNEQRQ